VASILQTAVSAQEAVRKYLAENHPMLAGCDVSLLKLQSGWLVETVPGADGAQPGARVVMMVNRFGVVDELDDFSPRRTAQRWLGHANVLAAS
jgi:cytosine/adenosine deaminase-related metal-dependent hydrolase